MVVIAAAWMQVNGVQWTPNYLDNIKFSAANNSFDDFTSANPARFLLINLQVPFYSFTHSRAYSNVAAFSVGAALIVGWVFIVLRSKRNHSELLALATIAVIGLLPLYHRLYDASVLAIPLCWCIRERRNATRRLMTFSLLLMAPFSLPTAALLQEAAGKGWISANLQRSSLWETLIMPHQTWLLLVLCITLLYAMAVENPSFREQPQHASEGPISLSSQGSTFSQ